MKLFEVLQPLLESQARIEKLAERYGENIEKVLRYDSTTDNVNWPSMSGDIHDWVMEFFDEDCMIEHDIEFVEVVDINNVCFKKKEFTEELVAFIAEKFDPTPNHKYLDWIIRQYIYTKEEQFSIEDDEQVNHVLSVFDQFKRHLPEKDINQYKTFHDLRKTIEPFLHEAADAMKAEAIGTGEAEVLYEADKERLVHVKTLKAAKAFSQDTNWCTQYPHMFNTYNEQGPIYIIDTANPDERVQIHFESSQIMDINDHPVNTNELMEDSPTYRWLIEQKKKEIAQLSSPISRVRQAYKFFGAGLGFDFVLEMFKTIPEEKYLYLINNVLKAAEEVQSGFVVRGHRTDLQVTQEQLEKGREILNNLKEKFSNS